MIHRIITRKLGSVWCACRHTSLHTPNGGCVIISCSMAVSDVSRHTVTGGGSFYHTVTWRTRVLCSSRLKSLSLLSLLSILRGCILSGILFSLTQGYFTSRRVITKVSTQGLYYWVIHSGSKNPSCWLHILCNPKQSRPEITPIRRLSAVIGW